MWKIKQLTLGLSHQNAGRNHHGRITVWHRGGGNKKLYRIIDYKRSLFNIPARILKIQYDPSRNSHIALINYKNGILSYILAPKTLKEGDIIESGFKSVQKEALLEQNKVAYFPSASILNNETSCLDGLHTLAANQGEEKITEISIGNALPLGMIPTGTDIHNIEMRPGKGGQLARASGTCAKIIKKEKNNCIIRLTSHGKGLRSSVAKNKRGTLISVSSHAMATIGIVSGRDSSIKLKKAGNSRWKNRRPVVRGMAMNPIDHPHGGGEGRSKGGGHPQTPWGKLTKGKPTVKKNKNIKQY